MNWHLNVVFFVGRICYMKTFILTLAIIISLIHPIQADELDTLARAIEIANKRINEGLVILPLNTEQEFEKSAGRQLEFALIEIKGEKLLTEEWYDLALYCLARKNKRYQLALNILEKEYGLDNHPRLKRWIKKRIEILKNKNFKEDNFDTNKELSDLRKIFL